MDKSTLKRVLPIAVFILLLVPIITSSLLDLEKKRENELIQQRILAEELAQRKAWEAEEKNYLMGKFDQTQKENFILIPSSQATNSEYKMYLRKEALEAFLQMQEAGRKDGIELKIASATRNFGYQKNIWNNKWNGIILVNGKNLAESIPNELERFKKILEYSAVPGTSRHHWGTDIDINTATPEYFNTDEGIKVYAWLVKNAPLFDFCQPYTLKGSDRPYGYFEEKWHWSYLPLAKTFTEEYKNLIKEEDISGFLGDKYVLGQDLINKQVLSINPDCL
ncbi:MAG: M15 family metallopeptidase [Candidatus Paceibacterota bacterium]